VPAKTVILALGVCLEVVDHFKAAFPDARVIDATQDAYGQAFVFDA